MVIGKTVNVDPDPFVGGGKFTPLRIAPEEGDFASPLTGGLYPGRTPSSDFQPPTAAPCMLAV